jgi:general secretion pathway protein K
VLIGNAVEVAHFAKLMRLLGIPGQVAEQVATATSGPRGAVAHRVRA